MVAAKVTQGDIISELKRIGYAVPLHVVAYLVHSSSKTVDPLLKQMVYDGTIRIDKVRRGKQFVMMYGVAEKQ